MPSRTYPVTKQRLYELGVLRVQRFCIINNIECPEFTLVDRKDWSFDCCAYYRSHKVFEKEIGEITICLEKCQHPCNDSPGRNWTWPGNLVDREPYGVLCHELGHHVDLLTGDNKFKYSSEYSGEVMNTSNEKAITSYCPNPAEWFAEMFRVFVTNPDLLKQVRPVTYSLLCKKFKPIPSGSWRTALGTNCPQRVIKSLVNKGAK